MLKPSVLEVCSSGLGNVHEISPLSMACRRTLPSINCLPQQWGFSIPLFVSYDRRNVKPHFDPLDPDTPLNTHWTICDPMKSGMVTGGWSRKMKSERGINFSNVRKVKTKPGARNHFYDFENFAFNYAFSDDKRRNILTQEYSQRMYKGGIAYVYSSQPKAIEPFKNWKATNRWSDIVKDFNVTLLPNTVSVRTDVDRRFLKHSFAIPI